MYPECKKVGVYHSIFEIKYGNMFINKKYDFSLTRMEVKCTITNLTKVVLDRNRTLETVS